MSHLDLTKLRHLLQEGQWSSGQATPLGSNILWDAVFSNGNLVAYVQGEKAADLIAQLHNAAPALLAIAEAAKDLVSEGGDNWDLRWLAFQKAVSNIAPTKVESSVLWYQDKDSLASEMAQEVERSSRSSRADTLARYHFHHANLLHEMHEALEGWIGNPEDEEIDSYNCAPRIRAWLKTRKSD